MTNKQLQQEIENTAKAITQLETSVATYKKRLATLMLLDMMNNPPTEEELNS